MRLNGRTAWNVKRKLGLNKRKDANLSDDVERYLLIGSVRGVLFDDGDLSERVNVEIVQESKVEHQRLQGAQARDTCSVTVKQVQHSQAARDHLRVTCSVTVK